MNLHRYDSHGQAPSFTITIGISLWGSTVKSLPLLELLQLLLNANDYGLHLGNSVTFRLIGWSHHSDIMDTNTKSNEVQAFPPEIINHVIANLDLNKMTFPELTQLWVQGRAVSKQFLYELPKVFGQKLLPEIVIEYSIGKSSSAVFQANASSLPAFEDRS